MKRQSSLVLVIALVLTAALGAQQQVSPVADAAMRGDKTAICKISLRFFSPPENPSLMLRYKKDSSISKS